MSSDIKLLVAVVAVVIWLASWIVRRKNIKLGVILAWIATAMAVVAIILVLCR